MEGIHGVDVSWLHHSPKGNYFGSSLLNSPVNDNGPDKAKSGSPIISFHVVFNQMLTFPHFRSLCEEQYNVHGSRSRREGPRE